MHDTSKLVSKGAPLSEAELVILAVHGRGASPESMLSLVPHLSTDARICWLAPAATNNTWYPYSFMAPFEANQPWLDSALSWMKKLFKRVEDEGPGLDKLIAFGFSQGGCLALESVVRYGKNIHAVVGLSSGLIGPEGTTWNTNQKLAETKVYIGCSDVDFHIPLERVKESETVFKQLKADTQIDIFPNGDHTIYQQELDWLKARIVEVIREEA